MLGKLVKVAAATHRLRAVQGLEALFSEPLQELISMTGMEVSFEMLPPEARGAAFQTAARGAIQPGAEAFAIHGRDKDGNQFHGIVVAVPKQAIVEGDKVVRYSGGQVLTAPGEKPQG